MPTTWSLQFPCTTEQDIQLLRTHYEALRADPRITEVTLTMDAMYPAVRSMDVTFAGEFNQPLNPSYRYYNLRYPVRPSPPAFTTVDTKMGLVRLSTGINPAFPKGLLEELSTPPHAGVFDIQYTPPLPPLPKLELPQWVRKGKWARDRRTGLYLRIDEVSEQHVVCAWQGVAKLQSSISILEQRVFLQLFEQMDTPENHRPTSWARLLLDDDENT